MSSTPISFVDPLTCLSAPVTQWQLNMTNGALFGVPIPAQHEDVGEALQAAVEVALEEAEQNGMNKRGKEATPWLLKRVGELTKGASLASSQSHTQLMHYCAISWRLTQILHSSRTPRLWVRITDVAPFLKMRMFTNVLRRWTDSRGICEAVGTAIR
jgi:hypothetical protein